MIKNCVVCGGLFDTVRYGGAAKTCSLEHKRMHVAYVQSAYLKTPKGRLVKRETDRRYRATAKGGEAKRVKDARHHIKRRALIEYARQVLAATGEEI